MDSDRPSKTKAWFLLAWVAANCMNSVSWLAAVIANGSVIPSSMINKQLQATGHVGVFWQKHLERLFETTSDHVGLRLKLELVKYELLWLTNEPLPLNIKQQSDL